jgi:hypothetical protein
MSENPYAAPKAPVSDIESNEPMTRPRQVVWAIQLLVANYVFGIAMVIVNFSYYENLGSITAFLIGQVIGAMIGAWIYYKIWQGRNWARIVLLVFSLLGIIGWVIGRRIMETMPTGMRVTSVIGWIISIVVIWLLFFSPGRAWFRPRD